VVELETNKTFTELDESQSRVSVFQGGARSGKTYNILLWLIKEAAGETAPQVYTVCRATMPALKGTAWRDFIDILNKAEGSNIEYEPTNLNKSEHTYQLNNTTFEFISIDQPQKIRGRKRKYLFINEANEIDLESWRQLSMRTTDKIILDYNPSMEFHWIYDEVLTRDDSDFYQSTYLDNPFLEQSIINEIERLQSIDANYWKIYGLGERGQLKGLVYPGFNTVDEMPTDYRTEFYGLDFGYTNDPTALVRVLANRHDLFIDEIIYQTGLQNRDIAAMMHRNDVSQDAPIYADSAEPKSIDELYSLNFNVHGAEKGRDSIKNGINLVRQFKLNVTKRSINIIKELRNYKYQEDRNGRVMNQPVDAFNHGLDALRYGVSMAMKPKAKEANVLYKTTRTNRI